MPPSVTKTSGHIVLIGEGGARTKARYSSAWIGSTGPRMSVGDRRTCCAAGAVERVSGLVEKAVAPPLLSGLLPPKVLVAEMLAGRGGRHRW